MKEEQYELKLELGEKHCNSLADSILEFKIKGFRHQIVALNEAITKELEKIKS